MNEMIERVAAAIDGLIREPCTLTCGQIARVAIEAMREPTEAMKKAACDQYDPLGYRVWPWMIDAALKE
jgi:hypothetical protein